MSLMNELPEYTEASNNGYVPYSEDGEHLGKINVGNLGAGMGGEGLQYWKEREKTFYNSKPLTSENIDAGDGHLEFHGKHYNMLQIPEGGTEYQWTSGGVNNADVAAGVVNEADIYANVVKSVENDPHQSNHAGNIIRVDQHEFFPLFCPADNLDDMWSGISMGDVEPSETKIYEGVFKVNTFGLINADGMIAPPEHTPHNLRADHDSFDMKPVFYYYDVSVTVYDDSRYPQPYELWSKIAILYENNINLKDTYDNECASAVNAYDGDGHCEINDSSYGTEEFIQNVWAIAYLKGTERNMLAKELESYFYAGSTSDDLDISGKTITVNGQSFTATFSNDHKDVVQTTGANPEYRYWNGKKWVICTKTPLSNTVLRRGYDVNWDGNRPLSACYFPNQARIAQNVRRYGCRDYDGSQSNSNWRRPYHIAIDVPELDDDGNETNRIWSVTLLVYRREGYNHDSENGNYIRDLDRYPYDSFPLDPGAETNLPNLEMTVDHWAYYKDAKPKYDVVGTIPEGYQPQIIDRNIYNLSVESQREYYRNARIIAQKVLKAMKVKSENLDSDTWKTGEVSGLQIFTAASVQGSGTELGYNLVGGLKPKDWDIDTEELDISDADSKFSIKLRKDEQRYVGDNWGSVFRANDYILGPMQKRANPLAADEDGETSIVNLLDIIQGRMEAGENIEFEYVEDPDTGYLITKIKSTGGGGGGGSNVAVQPVANPDGRKIVTITVNGTAYEVFAPRITVENTPNTPSGYSRIVIKESSNESGQPYTLATFNVPNKGLPDVSASDNGKSMVVVNGGWMLANVNALPAVTSSDNGYILRVINGAWGKGTVKELPTVTSSDNGKVLGVVNSQWAAITPSSGGGNVEISSNPLQTITINDSSREDNTGNETDYKNFIIKSWGPYSNGSSTMSMKRYVDISVKLISGMNWEQGDKLRVWLWPSAFGTNHAYNPLGQNEGRDSMSSFKPSFEALDVTVDIDPTKGALAHISGHLNHYIGNYGEDTFNLMAEIIHANTATVASAYAKIDYCIEKFDNWN